jgi:hypothetical protein
MHKLNEETIKFQNRILVEIVGEGGKKFRGGAAV